MADDVETTVYDVLRRLVEHVFGAEFGRDLIDAINRDDPHTPDPAPEPTEPAPADLPPADPSGPTDAEKDAEIAALKEQLAAAQAAPVVPAQEPATPDFSG
jgi:hypothetical protein